MPSPDIRPYTVAPHVAQLTVRDGRVVYEDGAPRRSKVAICGAAGARSMPWDDPTFECWAMNNFWNAARDSSGRLAASRWWEQHQITPDAFGPHAGAPIQDANDMRWINTCPVPLYTTEPWPANPNAVVWPVDAMAAKYRDYFTCTFAMQVCQALDEGFEELHVYGLELLAGTQRELSVESSCLAYWLGLAEGRGVKVVIPPRQQSVDPIGNMGATDQWLLRHPFRYGHDYWDEADWVRMYCSTFPDRKVAV